MASIEQEQETAAEANTVSTSADAELDKAKHTFTSVVVIGVKPDGGIDVRTNLSSYEHAQYLFHRASFEIFIHQRDAERR